MSLTPRDFVLEEIEKIVRKRWRIIERTTQYGWLGACCCKSTITHQDAQMLSALATKVGYENCKKAFRRIKDVCRDVHPNNVSRIALFVLDESYSAVMLRRKRDAKWENRTLRDMPPTVFTISKDIF